MTFSLKPYVELIDSNENNFSKLKKSKWKKLEILIPWNKNFIGN